MKIVVMEPLGVKMEQINALAAPLQAAGHDFVYYTAKETDQTKLLARVQQADIIMLANQPLSAEIINACSNLKMLSVAFTGVDHIALAACRERQRASLTREFEGLSRSTAPDHGRMAELRELLELLTKEEYA